MKPYIRTPTGVSRVDLINKENRLAATPFGCGRCLPCRTNKARVWTHRILLEQSMNESSVFATLTYDDEKLPEDGNLDKKELQKFWKRLRKSMPDRKIRYFACGEYGPQTWRPHYHAAIFGTSIQDQQQIEKSWQKGFVHVGDLTKDSARYMTGYILKNQFWQNESLEGRTPEFATQSRNPGIGALGIDKVADKLHKNKFYHGQRPKELQYGRKTLPLGRYLQNRLDQGLEIPEETREDDLLEYQLKIHKEHLKEDKNLFDSIVDSGITKRLSMEKKAKIFRQKRRI